MFLDLIRKEKKVNIVSLEGTKMNFKSSTDVNFEVVYNKFLDNLDDMHWYDKKVFEYIEGGESIASLSEKTKISYYSLYNTYRRVKETLLEKI